jgi:hypothetical protein
VPSAVVGDKYNGGLVSGFQWRSCGCNQRRRLLLLLSWSPANLLVDFGEDKVCSVTGVLCPLFEIRISRALVELFQNMISTFQIQPKPKQVRPVQPNSKLGKSYIRQPSLSVLVTLIYWFRSPPGSSYFGWSSRVQAFSIHFAVNSCQFSLYFIWF